MSSNKWLIVRLSDNCDLTYAKIEFYLKETFGNDIEYFIPIYHCKIRNYEISLPLFDKYVFIKDSKKVRDCILQLPEDSIFKNFLYNCKDYCLLSDEEIQNIKNKTSEIINFDLKVGDCVKINHGVFKDLNAIVVDYDKNDFNTYYVKINLLSKEIIAPLPKLFLCKES